MRRVIATKRAPRPRRSGHELVIVRSGRIAESAEVSIAMEGVTFFRYMKKSTPTASKVATTAIGPLFMAKSLNPNPSWVPRITFGGSPTSVDEPPMLAMTTSPTTSGTGSIFRIFAISIVSVATRA